MNIVLSVTVHYDNTCTDETVTNTAKLTGKEMHNETNVVTADASFTHRFDSDVRYGGGFNKRAMRQFERGKQGKWLYSYSNTSNVPVVMEHTDYLTCDLVSPTDGSNDCDKPFMRVKTMDTQTTTPIEITYWTNKGNTGTQTIYRSKACDFSSFAADEYLTVFHYNQTIPADDYCDFLTLGTALPKYYNPKSTIKGNLASPGSEVTFSVTANNTSTVVDSQPVISDLLPCGMTFVEGSVTGGPAGKEKTVTVRDVSDATGCTRQLVQVTWPGYQTKGGTTIQGGDSRGSEWEPILTGPLQVGAGSGIDPSQVTIEYSTSFNPCRGEVMKQSGAMASGPGGCDNNWTTTPASWADVKSYRIYINGKATPIKAGASIPIIAPIKAPDNAIGIAYESVAIAATQASNNRAILPAEPIKVAIALALDVALNKTVVSDASNLKPGDQVTYRIDAGNIGQGKAPDLKVKEAFPVGTTFVSAETHKCTSGYTTGLPQECQGANAAGTFDGLIGGAGLGAAVVGGMFLWMRRRRQD